LLSTEEKQVLDVALNIINSQIRENLSDYEKQLIVHDYIVKNCVYDSVNYNNNTIPDTSRTPYGALVLGVAVCQGYSSAFKLLMDMLGIECDIITGFANGDSHAWNRVKIDGDYYLVDVTWDDPTLKENVNREVYYDFFNLTDEAMNASHTASEPQIKEATSTKYNYFHYNNLVVSSKSDFFFILQDALDKDETYVYVLCENIDLRGFVASQEIFQYLGGKSHISYSFSDKVNTLYLQFE
jgi:transglutaminase/protease-like cytokinesis protein 3